MAHLHDLVEEASTMTSSMTGFDYSDDDDHEDDDATPSLIIFYLQEFVRPPSNPIYIFGSDDKANAECGQDVAISATVHHYVRVIVSEGQALSASEHDFNI